MDFEIYFSDLKEDAQKELLKSRGILKCLFII